MAQAENLGTGGSTLNAQYGSTAGANTNQPLLLEHDGTSYVYLPGLAGNFISVPDAVELDMTGNIDIRLRVALTDWTPAADMALLSKTDQASQRAYLVQALTTGVLQFVFSTTGAADIGVSSTAHGFADGLTYWLRVTRNSTSGAVTFERAADSPTMPTVWTAISSTTSTTGAMFASTVPLRLGIRGDGANPAAGKFYRAQVRSGIGGTVVLDTDFSTMVTTGSEVAMLSPGAGSPVIPEALQTLPNLGWGGGVLDARYGSTAGADTNDPLLLTRTTENYLYLPGTAGNWSTVGSSSATQITGDLDLRARVAFASWTSGNAGIITKWGASPALSFYWMKLGNVMRFGYSSNGSTGIDVDSAAMSFAADEERWVRVTLDVDNGAGSRVITFFTSTDGVTWTTLSTTATAGTISLFPNNANILIGNHDGTHYLQGRIFRAQILNGIGGTVALDVNYPTGIVDGAQTSLSISGTAADQLDNALVLTNLGTGGPVLNGQRGSSLAAADTNDPQVLSHTGTNYVYVPGLTGNNLTMVSDTSNAFTTEVDYIVRMDRLWSGAGTNGGVIGRYGASSGAHVAMGSSNGSVSFTLHDGTAYVGVICSAQTSGDGARWLRVTWRSSDGRVQFFFNADEPTVPTVWTQLGIDATLAAGATITQSAEMFFIAGSATTGFAPAKVLYASAAKTIGGVPTVLVDTSVITTGAATSFTATTGQTVTINRSTSGRKSVAVVQPTLLFGTDDYLDIPDSDLIDLGTSDSLTVMVAARVWGNAPSGSRFLHKGGITGPRWGLAAPSSGALNRAQGFITDGVAATVTADSGTYTYGTLSVLSATFNRATQQILAYVDSTPGTASSSIAGLNATGATSARVGSNVNTGYMDMELYGVAIWRRSLSASELGTIASHYSGTVTPASLALLGEAVCWIDPARSKQAAAIARSTSGRKSVAVTRDTLLFATDDYLEVPDNDLIDFGATDSYTFTVAVRQWSTSPNFGPYVSKILAASTGVGYAITNNGTGNTSLVTLADGVIAFGSSVTSSAYATGAARVLSGVVNRQDQTGKIFTGGVENASLSTAAIGSFASGNPLRFGTVGAGTGGFADMEFYGAAVFRRALSAAELATVNAHYQTGPTTASTALLSQAVLWLDPTQRRVASINRAASGRKSVAVATSVWSLGTDDYFEVPDSVLLDMGTGQDFTALVIQRPWWLQGTSDTLVAKVDTTTTTAQGWAVSNPTTGDALRSAGRIGTGATGVEAFGAQRLTGQRQAVLLVRSGATLTAWTGGTAGTPVTSPAGDLSNSSVMRIGRLSGAGTEYLDSEIRAVAVWRRALTTAEIAAVLNYYGAA